MRLWKVTPQEGHCDSGGAVAQGQSCSFRFALQLQSAGKTQYLEVASELESARQVQPSSCSLQQLLKPCLEPLLDVSEVNVS